MYLMEICYISVVRKNSKEGIIPKCLIVSAIKD